MASCPLSELVWCTDKGLGLRYVDGSSPEKKAPVLWDTELFNIVVSPALNSGKEGSKDIDLAERKLEPIQSDLNAQFKHPNEVNYHRSQRRSHRQYLNSFRDLELFSKMEEATLDHNQEEFRVPNKTEVGSFSTRINQNGIDIFDKVNNTDKDFIPGGAKHDHYKELDASSKCGSPVNSESSLIRAACGCVNLLLDKEEDWIVKCSFHRASIDFVATESNVVVESQSREKGKLQRQASLKDKSAKVGKGKSVITYNSGEIRRGSEVAEYSHDRVEGSSGNLSLSTRKRAWSIYADPRLESKKFKTQSNGNYITGSTHRQGSSFMHWISTMFRDLGSDYTTSLLALILQPSQARQRNDSLLSPNGETDDTIYSKLLSAFQAIYHPRSRVQYRKHGYLNHLIQDEFFRHIQVLRKQFSSGTHRIIYDSADTSLDSENKTSNKICEGGNVPIFSQGEAIDFPNQIYTSGERLLPHIYPYEESPSITLTDYSTHHEESQDSSGKYSNVPYIGCPGDFGPNNSGSVNGKGTDTTSLIPNNSADNRKFLKNLWITRLSAKVSALISNQTQCNQSLIETEISLNMTTDPPYLNDFTYIKENIKSSNQYTSLEGQRIGVSRKFQVSSIFPTGSYVSKERKANQKLSSAMEDMLSSQFQILKSTEVQNGAFSATTTCFFCGNSSHGFGGCSELVEFHQSV